MGGRQGVSPHQDGQVGPAPCRRRLRIQKVQRPESQGGRDCRLRGQDEAHLGRREGRRQGQVEQGTAHHLGQRDWNQGSRQLLKKVFQERCRFKKTTLVKPLFSNTNKNRQHRHLFKKNTDEI